MPSARVVAAPSLLLALAFALLGCQKTPRTTDGPAPAPDAAPAPRPSDPETCLVSEARTVDTIARAWTDCATARADELARLLAEPAAASDDLEAAVERRCATSRAGVSVALGESQLFLERRTFAQQGADRVARDRQTVACLPGALARLTAATDALAAKPTDRGAATTAVLAAEDALSACIGKGTRVDLAMIGLLGNTVDAQAKPEPPPGPLERSCSTLWGEDPFASLLEGSDLGGGGGGGGTGRGTIGLGTIGTLGRRRGTGSGYGVGGSRVGGPTPTPTPTPPPPPPFELIAGTQPGNLALVQRRVQWAFCRRSRQLRCCAAAAGKVTPTPVTLRVKVTRDGTLAAVGADAADAPFATCATDVLGGLALDAPPDQGEIELRYRTHLPPGVTVGDARP